MKILTAILLPLSIIIFITIIYRLGRLFWALKWGLHHKYYFIGSGPKLFTVSFKPIKFSFGIWIPFIGPRHVYNFETGQKEHANLPWEFYEFSKIKRLIVTLGGLFSLILTSIILFIIVSYAETLPIISKEEINRYGIYPTELSVKAGFHAHDKILSFNGNNFESYYDLINPSAGDIYTILRNSKKVEIKISKDIASQIEYSRLPFFYINIPFIVDIVEPHSPAFYGGLQQGDKIKSVNGVPIVKLFELKKELDKNKDREATLEIERLKDNRKSTFLVNIQPTEDNLLGFTADEQIQYSYKRRSFMEALTDGSNKAFRAVLFNPFDIDKLLRSGPVKTEQIHPPKGIANNIGGPDWQFYFLFLASLCGTIALYNLLPLPWSAFWEILPLAWEFTLRKQFTFGQYMSMRKLGIWFFIGLLVLSFVNDLLKILN